MAGIDDAFWSLKNLVLNGVHVNPQHVVEHRTWSLMSEFPELPDHDIATLVRDEIINARGDDQALLKWATADTVARLRRTVAVQLVRREREFEAAAPRAAEEQAARAAAEARSAAHPAWSAPHAMPAALPAVPAPAPAPTVESPAAHGPSDARRAAHPADPAPHPGRPEDHRQPTPCRDCGAINPWWVPGCERCNGSLVGDDGFVSVRTCKACKRKVRKADACGACGAAFA